MCPAVARKKRPAPRPGQPAGGQRLPPAAKPSAPGEGVARNIAPKRGKAHVIRDALATELRDAIQRKRMARFLTHARQFGYGKLFAKDSVRSYFASMGLQKKEARLLFANVAVRAHVDPAHMVKILESVLSHPQSSAALKDMVTQKPIGHLISFFRQMKKQVGKPRPR